MEQQMFFEKIADADLCLIGIGEDFDVDTTLKEAIFYQKGFEFMQQSGTLTLLPAWRNFCVNQLYGEKVQKAVDKLADILKDKNYFVISLSTNELVASYSWKHERIVSPCGSIARKQCISGHGDVIPMSFDEMEMINQFFRKLADLCALDSDNAGAVSERIQMPDLGVCPECGEPMVLNTVYADNYIEAGYLPKWELYKKWLQGTVNRKLVILELGVGLKYPSVIRWPFEKIAFFNEKSYFFRVHDRLSQLTPELSQKGLSISQNPIDWIMDL